MTTKPDFIHRNWHIIAAMVYFVICFCDFVALPAYALVYHLPVWQPTTLGDAGIFHMAYCGLMGVGTWAYHTEGHKRSEPSPPASSA